MHPALKKGTKKFHYTSNSCGIFVIAFFHETKIPTMDMKVQVYSKFSKKKKIKSPSSMENGRFHPPKQPYFFGFCKKAIVVAIQCIV
jgi:hypothetical protein